MNLWFTTDYRDYLKSIYESRKKSNPNFSYRVWGSRLQLDAPLLNRILHKKQHLPLRYVEILGKDLKLKGREMKIFRLLVAQSRAKGEEERENISLQLLALKDVERNTLDQQQFRFFSNWYHTSLRCLIGAREGTESFEDLARWMIPPLKIEEVKNSIELQCQLGLLKKQQIKKKTKYSLSERHLSTDAAEVHQAIRSYQKKMLVKGIEAMDRFSKEERDFSTLTFAVDAQRFEEIKEILKETRRQIQRCIDSSGEPDGVYHLNMNIFPTARWDKRPQQIENDEGIE